MRVTFASVEDFCDELRREAAHILRRQVRTRIDRVPEQEEEITFLVGIWGTAIASTPEGDFLLEYGELCGSDSTERDAPDPSRGSDAARERGQRIADACSRCGLTVRPGKIEVV